MAGEPSSTHDVFLLDLSESGTATWNSGLLLEALRERRIRTFTIEDVELLPPGGDEIPQAVVTAIEASKIAIVVVPGGTSHDVSLRRWNVLIYILDYFQRNPQRIIPVYYMDRSHAHCEPSGVHEEPSFEGRKKKFRVETGNDEYKVSKAIAQLDSLPGWDFVWNQKNKDKFNREIASQVSKMLHRPPLDVAVYPVGLQSRLEEVWWLLKLSSSNREFLKIVFYGIQEGIRKSTLALAVYNSIAHLFEVSCFLPNIGQNSNTHGLVGIQKMLLSQISGGTGIHVENVSEGASMIEDMLLKKDVLLILDDVDSLDQLDALGRGPDWWFSDGSIVIITTREKGWLGDRENEFLPYDVQGALTTSQSVSRVSEVSQTSLIDPEGSQTTRVAGVTLQSLQWDFQAVMWGLVFFVSSGVGLLCYALSPPFKRSIRGWTLFKFFPYVVFSLAVLVIILRSNRYQIIRKLIVYICYAIFLGISVYSYFYERAVDGNPGILSLVSNAAFAVASLSLSKLFGADFETGIFSYFLQCFTVQLITTDWKLIFVAIIFGGLLFRLHFSSEPFLLTRITRRFGTIPLRNLNDRMTRRFSGGRPLSLS